MFSPQYVKRMLRLAYAYAMNSDDPLTHVGAVIVRRPPPGVMDFTGEPQIIGFGCNHLPVLPSDITPVQEMTVEYKRGVMLHAEQSAINNAQIGHGSVRGAHMFAPWAPCLNCAAHIVEAGIAKLWTHFEMMSRTPPKYRDSIDQGIALLGIAGCDYEEYHGTIGNCTHLFYGETWNP